MKLHQTTDDTTRPSNRRLGIECAHHIADAFRRVPAEIDDWLEALPDELPAFADALEWCAANTPAVVPAMKMLRRHFVCRIWNTKPTKTEPSRLEWQINTPALDNAWGYALQYASRFADQDQNKNPMQLATPEEAATAFAFMRRQIAGKIPESGEQLPHHPKEPTLRERAGQIARQSKVGQPAIPRSGVSDDNDQPTE